MKIKASSSNKNMRIRGFMCHSHDATAICIQSGGHKSVIVPARRHIDNSHARFINKGKYTRLLDESHSNSSPLVPASEIRKPPYFFPLCIKSKEDQEHKYSKSTSSSSSTSSLARTTGDDQLFQVIVMRVALHCQGCAGKVKRHLSKMEGVTSFSIDLESKKVTVIGKLSPVSVLEASLRLRGQNFGARKLIQTPTTQLNLVLWLSCI